MKDEYVELEIPEPTLPKKKIGSFLNITKKLNKVGYIEVPIAQILERDKFSEHSLAWDDLTNHHAIPFVKEGRYLLTQFWTGYSNDPYENLEASKNDYGDDWENEGMLGKVVADYILTIDPLFNDWENVLLHATW